MIDKVAKSFVEMLEKRLSAQTCTSEDCLRYTLFAALLKHGIPQERVVLEWPHPAITGAKIDAVILDQKRYPVAAVEFKYDRANPGRTNQPMPQKAGAMFNDFVRLLKLKADIACYFVYLTDGALANYLSSERNGLAPVFLLDEDARISITKTFFSGRSATFMGAMGPWVSDATIRSVVRRNLPASHHLRIYEVRPV